MQIYLKFFKSLWGVHFCWMSSPPEPKFWRRHCSTGLKKNSCMKFCPRGSPPPNQNPGAATGCNLWCNINKWSLKHCNVMNAYCFHDTWVIRKVMGLFLQKMHNIWIQTFQLIFFKFSSASFKTNITFCY